MSRELDVQEGVKVAADGADEGESPAVRGGRNRLSCALNRRSFLRCALASGAALGVGEFVPVVAIPAQAAPQKQDDSRFTVEAKFYEKLPNNKKIKCKLCPRECTVGDRERGYCGVRENRGGTYYTLVHSRACAARSEERRVGKECH